MLSDIFVSAGDDFATYTKIVPAPFFRKRFIRNAGGKAVLTIGATGFYDLYLNGKKITDGYLMPYISNPEQIIFYNEYDLTHMLIPGENVIGVMLGNGYANPIGGEIWNHNKDRCAPPAFALDYRSNDVTFNAMDMVWSYSHILFDDYRCGTYCDATKMQKSWCLPEFDDSLWQIPTLRNYSSAERRLCTCPPVKEIRRIKAVEITEGALRDYRMRDAFDGMLYNGETVMGKTPVSGGYIYDFGENVAGVPCLKIKGKKGQKIHMQFCELMFEGFADYINTDVYPDGCCQRDVYICRGDEEEEYIPPFTYHGFRYCYIYGITKEQLTQDLVTCIVLHNDVKFRSHFTCSDHISNTIFEMCRRTDLSNLFYILTDCPQREKNGWTGDASVSAEHYIMNYTVEKCFSDWMHCMRKAQAPDGSMPLMVPSPGETGKCPVWDSALVFLPYYTYIYRGDKDIISGNASAMLKNLDFLLSLKDERGIIESGLGDWLPVDKPADSYSSPLGFCCTVIVMLMCHMMKKMFDSVGMAKEAEYVESVHNELRVSIRREYNDNGIIIPGRTKSFVKSTYSICQTSQVLGLYAEVFDEKEIITAADKLAELIKDNNDSFDCGFLGLRFIFHVLSKYGYSDLAYRMITKPEYPSYANMIYRGETTMWERFVKPGKRIGSHNHHFMADVSHWYIRCVAGINVNPEGDNPDKIYLEPHFIKELTFASASYETPGGKIWIKWQRHGEKIELKVKCEGKTTVRLSNKLNDVKIDML